MFDDIILESEGNVIISLLDCYCKEAAMFENGYRVGIFLEADDDSSKNESKKSDNRKWYQKIWDAICAAWTWICKQFQNLKDRLFRKKTKSNEDDDSSTTSSGVPKKADVDVVKYYNANKNKYPHMALDNNGEMTVLYNKNLEESSTLVLKGIMLMGNINDIFDQYKNGKTYALNSGTEIFKEISTILNELGNLNQIYRKKFIKGDNVPVTDAVIKSITDALENAKMVSAKLKKIKAEYANEKNDTVVKWLQSTMTISKRFMKTFGDIFAYIKRCQESADNEFKQCIQDASNAENASENNNNSEQQTPDASKDQSADNTTLKDPLAPAGDTGSTENNTNTTNTDGTTGATGTPTGQVPQTGTGTGSTGNGGNNNQTPPEGQSTNQNKINLNPVDINTLNANAKNKKWPFINGSKDHTFNVNGKQITGRLHWPNPSKFDCFRSGKITNNDLSSDLNKRFLFINYDNKSSSNYVKEVIPAIVTYTNDNKQQIVQKGQIIFAQK